MKLIVTLLALFILHGLADVQEDQSLLWNLENLYRAIQDLEKDIDNAGIKIEWITQKLDHFNSKNKKTWKMRYMANEQYYEEGGPIFIYVGGEWAIRSNRLKSSIIVDMTKEHKGILFQTEHRFYGESKPTKDFSLANLQYLHSRQALADLAHFVKHKRTTDRRLSKSKVIIIGCSYSASLAVWFNKFYPNLVDGTWASSAPLLAQFNLKEYYEVVGRALLQLGSRKCYNRIQNGIKQLEKMFADKRVIQAKKMLNLCSDFDHKNNLNLWSLFDSIAAVFATTVQTQRDDDVTELCNTVMSFKDDVTAVTATFTNKHKTEKGKCIATSYKDDIAYYKNTTFDSNSLRPWRYQMCNEFGWFRTTASTKQPFGSSVPENLSLQSCFDSFGNRYTKPKLFNLISNTNKMFGGKIPKVKNVYMTHGGLDPWRTMGLNEEQGATVIPNASHCADFVSISKDDSAEMRASKERLIKWVRKWLA